MSLYTHFSGGDRELVYDSWGCMSHEKLVIMEHLTGPFREVLFHCLRVRSVLHVEVSVQRHMVVVMS